MTIKFLNKLRYIIQKNKTSVESTDINRNTVLMQEAQDWGITQLAGTTTICRESVLHLAQRHGIETGGYLECTGSLRREPENVYSTKAVAVYVEGERIGYLPGTLAPRVEVSTNKDNPTPVLIRLFTAIVPKGFRGEAWYWIGQASPQWLYSETNWPPLSPQEKARSNQEYAEKLVHEAHEEGGERAKQFEQGTIQGIHYLETVEPIKQLKREGRLDEALRLCYIAIEGSEKEAKATGREPAPWHTEQAAIILRKLKRLDEEEAVLRRWIEHCPPHYVEKNPNDTVIIRLKKLQTKKKTTGKR
ncbi:hypothetical protein OZX62_04030 [Bifidobacterium sp. ESL0690]|uniref:hypothetical protein n=1 Tax=Bifidobacterium sp. ESL0690 TaxID=2983214 RepID=UPI0023F9FE89|nr:hypothetical protein [Bifidobacterium sp. ESL0690]WEV47443.1 hypothetical protein OZX62_04030 [Bifidobacterium sp. ESL0690]